VGIKTWESLSILIFRRATRLAAVFESEIEPNATHDAELTANDAVSEKIPDFLSE
jgi:hypothetical protein